MNYESTLIFLSVTITVGMIIIVPSVYLVRKVSKKIHANKKLGAQVRKLERTRVTKIGIIYNLIFAFCFMAALSLFEIFPNIRMPEYLIILVCVFLLGALGERILLRLSFKLYEKKSS